MRGVPHHLLDVAVPTKGFSAGEFAKRGRVAMSAIAKRGKLPILAGGTGFYVDALLGRISLPDVKPDQKLRSRLQKKTAAQLYAMLKKRDPKRAKPMNTPSERNNKVRLIRALEIAASKANVKRTPHMTHRRRALGRHQAIAKGAGAPNSSATASSHPTRAHRRRTTCARTRTFLQTHGRTRARIPVALAPFAEQVIKKEFEEELYRDIRRYAKKQLAYWRRNKDIRWYDPKRKARITRDVATWLRAR